MKKKLIIAGIVVFVAFVALLMLPSMLIDENEFAETLKKEAQTITGYQASVANVEINVLPSPRLVIKQFAISNHPNASSDRLLLVDQMVFRLGLFDLLKGDIVVRGAEIVHPVVELESFADGVTNYEFIDRAALPNILKQDSTELKISGGLISSTNAKTKQVYEFKDINATVNLEGTEDNSSIDLAANIFGKQVTLSSAFRIKTMQNLKNAIVEGELNYAEEGSTLNYKGLLGMQDDKLRMDGTAAIESKDVIPWFSRIAAQEHTKGMDALQTPLPMKLDMKISADRGRVGVTFNDMEIASTTVGKGALSLSYNTPKAYAVDLKFKKFGLFEVFKDASYRKERDSLNHFLALMLPKNVAGTINVHSDEARVLDADGSNMVISASLDDGELVINQSYVHFPGESQAILFGILKPNEEGLIHLDGSVEFYGKDFSAFIEGLGYSNLKSIIKKTAPFRGKANLFFSDQQSTLSEFKFQAGDLMAAGGMTTQSEGGAPTVELTLKTSGLRLDPFFSLIAPITQSFNVSEQLGDTARSLPWLDNVRRTFIMNLSFENFELGSFNGTQANMVMTVAPKHITINPLSLDAGELNISGNIGFDQTAVMPNVDLNLNISQMSLMPFLGSHLRKLNIPRGNQQTVWSQEAIDMGYLRGFNGDINITIGRALHPAYTLQNLSFEATNRDGVLAIKNLETALWGGAMRFSGTLEASSVYSLQGSFYFDNINAQDMLQTFADNQAIRGKLNLSGQVKTTGMNADGWIKNAQLNAVFKGVNLVFKGFDLQGLIQAVSAVRSVADVVNTSRVALFRRETMFDSAEGSLYLENGTLKANDTKLRASNAVGRILGDVDIINWMMNVVLSFQLTSLSPTEYPTVLMSIQDSADNPVVGLDTRVLEGFVARKSVRSTD